MSKSIQVVVDVICPWCFIGKRHLERALSQNDGAQNFSVEWLPYELDPSTPTDGAERIAYRIQRFGSLEKSHAMDTRARTAGAEIGIQFRYDLIGKTPNTLNAHRLIWYSAKYGIQSEMVEAIFQAYFLEGQDIGSTIILSKIARQLKMESELVSLFLKSNEGTSDIKKSQMRTKDQGLNGVPFFLFNGVPQTEGFNTINQIIKGDKNEIR